MSYIGTNKVGKMYLGDTAIGKAYLGEDLVYDSAGGGTTPVLPYDAEIVYLQSSGTQYIDTGIIGNQNTKIEVKFYPTQLDSFVYGCRGDNTNSITFFVGSNDNERFGNQTYLASLTANTLYEVAQDKTKVTINGFDHNYGTVSNFATPYNLYLFGASGTEYALSHKFNGRLYYMKIWNGDTLARDFIPARIGTTGYMYDRVSGQLFGNSGSGSFVLGNDVGTTPVLPDGYAQLDYVQGVTRVISTNISPVNSQWEFDVVCDSSTTSNEVIICTGVGYGGQFAAACYNGKWGLGTGAGYYTSVNVTTRSTIFITYTSNGITMTIGNETVSRTGTNGHTNKPSLFGTSDGNFLFRSGKIYSVKCLSGGSFNGVPAQRISDNKNGIYDLANDMFYPLT